MNRRSPKNIRAYPRSLSSAEVAEETPQNIFFARLTPSGFSSQQSTSHAIIMVKTRRGVDTTSPRAGLSSKTLRSSKKRRRETETTGPKTNSKKRKATSEPQPGPEELPEAEEYLEVEPHEFHDESLLPAFEEATLAFQEIQNHIQNVDYTDEDDSVLEVPLKFQSPTQTVEIIATPSTRKENTAEPDGEEGDVTEYFTPHTSKKDRGDEQPATSATLQATYTKQTPTTPSKHIRFSSASPAPEDIEVEAESAAQPHLSSHEDTDSDEDAAPEELTVADAHTQQKPKSAKAKHRRKAKNKARKERRSRVAAKLKEESSLEVSDAEDAESAPTDAAVETALDPDNLPELLPDHILNAEPSLPPDTENTKRARPNANARKRHWLRANGQINVPGDKKAKDVKRGPVSVRVLEEQNKMLAPKVVSDTRHVRDGWMKGRQNVARGQGKKGAGKGEGKMQRRAFGSKAKAFV